jgi:hypothetical protein
MDRDEADAVIAAYEALVARAVKVASTRARVREPEFARVSIEGDSVTVAWPSNEDDPVLIERDDVTFPAHLLFNPSTVEMG